VDLGLGFGGGVVIYNTVEPAYKDMPFLYLIRIIEALLEFRALTKWERAIFRIVVFLRLAFLVSYSTSVIKVLVRSISL
jgi:hypothetical protein